MAARLSPFTSTFPLVGRSSPARRRSSEDLPLPEAPTTAATAPRRKATSTPRKAWTCWVAVAYVFTSPWQAAAGRSVGKAHHLGEVRPLGGSVGQKATKERNAGQGRPRGKDEGDGRAEEWCRRDVLERIVVAEHELGSCDREHRTDREGSEQHDAELECEGKAMAPIRKAHPSRECIRDDPASLARLQVDHETDYGEKAGSATERLQ